MTDDECLQRFGLTPSPKFAAEIRKILVDETAKERESQGAGDGELLKLTCLQLFTIGELSDALLIWRAKQSSFDKACCIDVQLVCGAGFNETVEYLDELGTEEAVAAAAYLRKCNSTGDFEDFTRDDSIAEYARYFEVDVP